MQHNIPRIISVIPHRDLKLGVTFENGITKQYDCKQLLQRVAFAALQNEALFRTAHVDAGGYGVSWNDDIDISEYELWTHGVML